MSSVERMTGDWKAIHGFLGSESWTAPAITVKCEEASRPGRGSRSRKGNEYLEDPETLKLKVKVLADLLRRSYKCLAYTGAGISTAAGIDDYASIARDTIAKTAVEEAEECKIEDLDSSRTSSETGGVSTGPADFGSKFKAVSDLFAKKKKVSVFDAQPTYGHRAMVTLFEAGLLKHWIQQNHDGLPQKAGFPQEHINEIHGAWYDPSNTIVGLGDGLREDLFSDLVEWEKKTDLCLAIGTSLTGMNADRCATTVARKGVSGKALGLVIITLQETQHDSLSCLRIFAKVDDVMRALMQELGLEEKVHPKDYKYVPRIPDTMRIEEDIFMIPFGTDGKPLTDSCTVLNLKKGAKVRITGGPYAGDVGVVKGKDDLGHYDIEFKHKLGETKSIKKLRKLGSFYLDAAGRGKGILESGMFPLANIEDDE